MAGKLAAETSAISTELFGTQEYPTLTPTLRKFLAAYTTVGTVLGAARQAECCAATHYQGLGRSEEYRRAFKHAQSIAAQGLVDTMLARAIHGKRKYRFNSKGDPLTFPEDVPELGIAAGDPYFDVDHPEVTGIFLSKTLAGLVERQQIEHTGSVKHEVSVTLALPPDAGSNSVPSEPTDTDSAIVDAAFAPKRIDQSKP